MNLIFGLSIGNGLGLAGTRPPLDTSSAMRLCR
jgi:hypothetical protein